MTAIQTPAASTPIAAEEQVRRARRERYADTYVRLAAANSHLRWVILALTLVVVGLIATHVRTLYLMQHLKPLVIRIDEVGRAQAIHYDAATYSPREPELRHFLSQFIVLHCARMRATVRRDFANSLMFLDARLAEATVTAHHEQQTLEKFLISGDPDVEIEVQNVTLQEIRTPPYRASVDFDRVYLQPNTRRELKRTRTVATLDFVTTDVPETFVQVNPLGLVVTYFREDQAFPAGGR